MVSRYEFKRAHARLLTETPISDDATLLEVEEAAADFIREAKRRDPSDPHEVISTVVDAVARDYFEYAIRTGHRRVRDALDVACSKRTTPVKPAKYRIATTTK